MDPSSDDTEATDDSSWSCGLNVQSQRSAVTLWQQAFTKLREAELDPWMDFPTFQLSTCFAKRHRYSAIKKKWVVDQVQVKIEDVSFDRGAMRECFRLKKLSQSHNDWQHASNFVAKRYISKVDRQVYFDDVQLQMEAKLWGEAFNRQNPPKKVDIFQLSVLEISRPKVSTEYNTETSNADSNPCVAVVSGDQESCLFHIERFMEGEYRKYNSNTGFVDEQLRNTPQAFSHFTFERSGHRLLVVDIQGVGDLYTDPQIHTSDGVGYSDGNLGPRGMAYFFHSHRCNPLCSWLGLAPFDLAPSELASIASPVTSASPHCQQLSPSGSGAENYSDEVVDEEHRNGTDSLPTSSTTVRADPSRSERSFTAKPSSSMSKFGPRRRSVSFSSHLGALNRFGPTVPRSSENMSSCSSSRRSRVPSFDCSSSGATTADSPDSASLLLQLGCSSLANLTLSYPELPDGQLDAGQNTVSSSLSALCLSVEPMASQLTAESLAKETAPILVVETSSTAEPVHLPGETVGGRSCLLYSVDQVLGEVKTRRDRTASGDSGYFGRIGLPPGKLTAFGNAIWSDQPAISPPGRVQGHAGAGSRPLFSASSDEFPLYVNTSHITSSPSFNNNNCSGRAPLPLRPRRRNLSESSDIDGEEGHRLGGSLLYQLMHESHKPSCTDHPTNLDQEIGHSILGQIHHELARLHEAGRFLPGCKGGWSCIGLGGLLLNDATDNDGDTENGHEHSPQAAQKSDPNSPLSWHDSDDREKMTPSVDWEAVLFHERHAAQLGCLEAMIVMAHYFLGLPTQLLFDCSIKPDQANIRSGIDYLWRAAEGGDRRCMILLACYLDLSATLFSSSREAGTEAEKLKPNSLLLIPALQTCPTDCFPPTTPDAWSEAMAWYDRAVVTAGCGHDSNAAVDDGLDAEGRYDAAEDLLPIYRILARMAEMYCHGGFGLRHNYSMAGDLFNRAGEFASSARQGRLAIKYFELAEEAYGKAE